MKKPLLTALLFLLTIPFFIFPASAADEEPVEHSLNIQYLNEDGSQAFPTYSARIAEGEEYSIPSPVSEEAAPNPETVFGIMGSEDVDEVVTYATTYPLVILCKYIGDNGLIRAYHAGYFEKYKKYKVSSPVLAGWTVLPQYAHFEGVMDSRQVNLTAYYDTVKYNVIVNCYYYDVPLDDPDRLFHTYTATTATLASNYSFYPKQLEGVECNISGEYTDKLKEAADVVVWIGYQRLPYQLTVKYRYADGSQAFPDHTESVKYLDPYSVESPQMEGWTSNVNVVSGTMGAGNQEVVVTYTSDNPVLTIDYLYPDGSQAAPSSKSIFRAGQNYSIMSPLIPGYMPDKPVISGIMGYENIHVTVTYNKTKYLLTIKYNRQSGKTRSSGTKIAPDYTGWYMEGEKYEIPSPSVMGYETESMTISGVMPAHDVIETVSYRLAGEPVMGDMSGLLDVVSSSGEYMREYLSKTLLTLVTAGFVMFAGFIVIRVILYIIRRFTRI